MKRKIWVHIAKAGLNGHDRGAKVVAAAWRDAWFEVIYSRPRKTAETIVESALQEDVNVIGVSLLSGAHMTIFPEILQLMKTKGMEDVLLFRGGIIPQKDIQELRNMRAGELFTLETTTEDIVRYLHTWNMDNQH